MTGIGMICVVIITMGVIGAIVVALLGNALREQEREKQAKEQQQSQTNCKILPTQTKAKQMHAITNSPERIMQNQAEAHIAYYKCMCHIEGRARAGYDDAWFSFATMHCENIYVFNFLKTLLEQDGFFVEKYDTMFRIRWDF